MTSHDKLYEIVQKVFNAGQEHERATLLAMMHVDVGDKDVEFPAAYPVITPLIEELVKYVDEQIEDEREECAKIAEIYDTAWGSDADHTARNIGKHIRERSEKASKPVRPSSPFRSVEIIDGKVNDA